MTIDIQGATVLVLAPHTDDGELGAGGSIAKWAASGNEVHYVAFSACETVQPPDRAADVLRAECAAATQVLGVAAHNLLILDLEVRQFPRDRQRVLDTMVQLSRELRPDLVLTPSTTDTHQDHAVVATESIRAFKGTRLLGYETPWNNLSFDHTAFVSLETEHVEAKVRALHEYRSQADRAYMTDAYVWSQTRFRGVQAGRPLAEVMQVIRWYL